MYRKNLSLFADTLNLKQDKHVKNYQEFFFKMHGILLFILTANVQGIVPYTSTITSSLINTFFIAGAIFINIIITLLKEKG
jgi:F0F1-type ATP synthase membrane subunit a